MQQELQTEKDIDWEQVRRDFPVTVNKVYLNSAASGPVPQPVMEAGAQLYREMMESGDARWDEWCVRREQARVQLAELINAEPDEIAFTTNTSSGMNLIVDALEGRGDVISCELEFPVSTLPWMHRGVAMKMIEMPIGQLQVEDVRQAMTERTRIISLSHVQFSNGFRADLEAIGRDKGEHTFVVNASQSVGVLGIDVKRMRIDALCATGHKWLLAGYGSGFLYMSRELLSRTRARHISWMSVENPFLMQNREFIVRTDAASRAETGVPHFASIFALGAAVDYLMKLGLHNIEQRALELNRHLTLRLQEIGWNVLSPIANENSRSAETLVAASFPANVVAHLAARGIHVTEKPQGIRVATHFFNNEADIERLIEALAGSEGT